MWDLAVGNTKSSRSLLTSDKLEWFGDELLVVVFRRHVNKSPFMRDNTGLIRVNVNYATILYWSNISDRVLEYRSSKRRLNASPKACASVCAWACNFTLTWLDLLQIRGNNSNTTRSANSVAEDKMVPSRLLRIQYTQNLKMQPTKALKMQHTRPLMMQPTQKLLMMMKATQTLRVQPTQILKIVRTRPMMRPTPVWQSLPRKV